MIGEKVVPLRPRARKSPPAPDPFQTEPRALGGGIELISEMVTSRHEQYLYKVTAEIIDPARTCICVFLDEPHVLNGVHAEDRIAAEGRLVLYLQMRKRMRRESVHVHPLTGFVQETCVSVTCMTAEDPVLRSLKNVYTWVLGTSLGPAA